MLVKNRIVISIVTFLVLNGCGTDKSKKKESVVNSVEISTAIPVSHKKTDGSYPINTCLPMQFIAKNANVENLVIDFNSTIDANKIDAVYSNSECKTLINSATLVRVSDVNIAKVYIKSQQSGRITIDINYNNGSSAMSSYTFTK